MCGEKMADTCTDYMLNGNFVWMIFSGQLFYAVEQGGGGIFCS